jgi:CIC family chloride channel protein
MTAIIGGVIQAPLTSVLIIFELTRNYGLIIPLLLASVISSIIFKKLSDESIYSPKLFHRL